MLAFTWCSGGGWNGARDATVLADAGYCNEAALATLGELGVDGYVALGREGRGEVAADAGKHPAMAAKLATEEGRAQYAQRKWRAEAPMDQGGTRLPSVQRARADQGAGGVGPGVPGAERQADERASGGLKTGDEARPAGLSARKKPVRLRLAPIPLHERPLTRPLRQQSPCDDFPTHSPHPKSSYGAGS